MGIDSGQRGPFNDLTNTEMGLRSLFRDTHESA